MVLNKPELIAPLQKEVRILLHLAGKLEGDAGRLPADAEAAKRAGSAALSELHGPGARRGCEERGVRWPGVEGRRSRLRRSAICTRRSRSSKHCPKYDRLLAGMSDADFRAEMTGFDGSKLSRGMFIISLVLGGHAAYRTQLFCYLKACGHEQLGTDEPLAGASTRRRRRSRLRPNMGFNHRDHTEHRARDFKRSSLCTLCSLWQVSDPEES